MKIPILHLEDGIHNFDFHVGAGTLHFYRDEIYPHDIDIHAEVNKFERNITCRLSIQTVGHYTCDRCLSEYEKPYDEHFELLFHLGKNDLMTDEEDVVILPVETVDIDLSDWIKEYLILTVPMKMLCKTDCKGICPKCGTDLNFTSCSCEEKQVDPR